MCRQLVGAMGLLHELPRIEDAEWLGDSFPPTVDESGCRNPMRSFFQETDGEKVRYNCKHDYQWQHHDQGEIPLCFSQRMLLIVEVVIIREKFFYIDSAPASIACMASRNASSAEACLPQARPN
jgi:hypothetical protein